MCFVILEKHRKFFFHYQSQTFEKIVDKNENPTSFVFCEQTVSIRNFFWHISKFRYSEKAASSRDVTTGATGATEVAPKFSDTLTLS